MTWWKMIGFMILILCFFYVVMGSRGAKKLPYYAKGTLLTKAELNFYRQLAPVLSEMSISASFKPRLWDIIEVSPNTEKKFTWQNKISSKHIDFVLLDGEANILGCIELDDSSHNRKDRMESDAFKNEALRSAGVPLIRVKTARKYKIDEIRNEIASVVR